MNPVRHQEILIDAGSDPDQDLSFWELRLTRCEWENLATITVIRLRGIYQSASMVMLDIEIVQVYLEDTSILPKKP